ncbi:TonB-dependent receptor plug domain-containing protein [Paremcibacter congregatus]|uniref:TonB-dependent receptor plug domain-containing protein n=1 Tax=Paremcibacter congregatus TaxID=2043170 RepID=UPI003A938FAF
MSQLHTTLTQAGKIMGATALCSTLFMAVSISAGMAQENPAVDKSAELEEIVSLGTRAKGRTALETVVPVDVLSGADMRNTGATEVGRMLQTLAPSFNFSSSSISDGTDALRPATLRGLGPDQTLVLINGKRRHSSALVHVNTSVGRGTAGVDMNAIPGVAIKRIEILRDGAAAQYGSDAIAGVINLELRDQSEGGDVSTSWGQTYEGDGATFVANGSYGMNVGNDGFVTLSVEYRDRERTDRSGLTGTQQYDLVDGDCGTACAFDPREYTFDRDVFRIGDGDSEQKAAVLNAGIPLSDNAEFYMFGTYSDRRNSNWGFYRRANQHANTVIELYPDGFLPQINSTIKDYSLAAGIDWTLGEWALDTSVSTGGNSFEFIISNSANASFGTASPTTARAGTLKIGQTTLNVDASRAVDVGGTEVNVAFGAEYRDEKYKILAGEPVSYADGGALNTNCPGCDVDPVSYASGFQVFRGFSPANERDEGRHNIAAYADIEATLTDNFTVDVAARFEDYSDFGSTFTAKGAARYDVTESFALRGSVSTGFRAPSMQQKYSNNTSTQFVTIGTETVQQERGTFTNDSPLAQAIGVPELKEETSLNFSAGFVASFDNLTITADYYHIDIDDRIGISSSVDIVADFPDVAAATGATSGQFFINAADTRTQGVDFVASYDVELSGDQSLKLVAAANWTETKVKSGTVVSSIGGIDVGPLFTPQDISIIEEWQPKTRINLSADYASGPWSVQTRASMFGTYTVCEGSCDSESNTQKFGAKWLTDVTVNYDFEESGLRLTAGVNNLFDVKPDLNLIGQSRGGSLPGIIDSPGVFKYSRRSAPFGFNGGYYYVKATYNF